METEITFEETIKRKVTIQLPYYSKTKKSTYRAFLDGSNICYQRISEYDGIEFSQTCEANVFAIDNQIASEADWLAAKDKLVAYANNL